MRKPRYFGTVFYYKVIRAYRSGELTRGNIDEWETAYNGGNKPTKSFGTIQALDFVDGKRELLSSMCPVRDGDAYRAKLVMAKSESLARLDDREITATIRSYFAGHKVTTAVEKNLKAYADIKHEEFDYDLYIGFDVDDVNARSIVIAAFADITVESFKPSQVNVLECTKKNEKLPDLKVDKLPMTVVGMQVATRNGGVKTDLEMNACIKGDTIWTVLDDGTTYAFGNVPTAFLKKHGQTVFLQDGMLCKVVGTDYSGGHYSKMGWRVYADFWA